MVLCVDAGNSFVKYTLATGKGWISLGRQTTKEAASARSRWPASFRHRGKRLASVDGVIVSSVVPSLNRRLSSKLKQETGRTAVFVDHRLFFPFKLRVASPGRLGMDRVCAAAGAARHGANSLIIVDVGSAITVDIVTKGEYRGGLIFAGPSISLKGLAEHAEQLSPVDYGHSPASLGGTTRRSMVLGTQLAVVGAIKEAVAFCQRRLRQPPRKFLTGGGAPQLAAHLPKSWVFDRDLVAKGLYEVWRLNFDPQC